MLYLICKFSIYCLSVSVSLSLSVCLYVYLYTCLYFLSLGLSICLFLSACRSVLWLLCLSAIMHYLSVSLFLYLSAHLPLFPVCLRISVYLSICLPVCTPVFMPVSQLRFACLSCCYVHHCPVICLALCPAGCKHIESYAAARGQLLR
jgi:hypothetical protein